MRAAQQRSFDRFRYVFDEERPHQALGMRTPGSLYEPSPRAYPARVPEPEYGSALKVRRVQIRGEFYWKHQKVFLSKVLAGERLGLLPIDERYYRVYFAAFALARFDSYRLRIEPLPDEEESEDDEDTSPAQRRGNVEISKDEIPTFPRHDDDWTSFKTKNTDPKCKVCPRSEM